MHKNRVFVVTAMRVGSTWMWNILAKYFDYKKVFIDNPSIEERRRRLTELNKVIIKGHRPFTIEWINNIGDPNDKFITIERNLLDSITSRAFFERYIAKGGSTFKTKILNTHINCPDKLWINQYALTQHCAYHIEEYYRYTLCSHPRLLKITYENLLRTPRKCLERVLHFLNKQPNARRINNAIITQSFKSKTGRNPGGKNNHLFDRSGTIGNHEIYFDNSTKQYIHDLSHKIKTRVINNESPWAHQRLNISYKYTP